MNDLTPLAALLAQAERQRDLALADQTKAQMASLSAQAQTDQLLNYRREYEQRWSAHFCREGQIELVRCYQGFMERLTLAVEGQARVTLQSHVRLDDLRTIVQGHELRIGALRKLMERRRAELLRDAQRDEQRGNDELAARIVWGRRNAAGRAEAS